MKYLVSLARIIVGNLFIFSGVVKANDPFGFSYKLEEYFVEFGMNWEWLHGILVPLAAFLCIVEIVIGVAVLVGWKMRAISWSLLVMIVFFTILTGASAIFEIVRSCGCFGDAIPLTPWESFYKDLILLFFILIIFAKRNAIKPWEKKLHLVLIYLVSALILSVLAYMLQWNMEAWVLALLLAGLISHFITDKPKLSASIAVVASFVYSLYLTIGATSDLPFKDFRPYAVGKNLPEQMILPPDAIQPVYENYLTYKNTSTGEIKKYTTAEYTASKVWEDKNWEWQSTESELIVAGDEAKITDLSVSNLNGEEITDKVLAEPKMLWIVCYDISTTSMDHIDEINQLTQKARDKGIKVYALSSAGESAAEKFKQQSGLQADFYITDGIVLKTMIRSNPGLMYLENGTVLGKWHESNLPSVENFKDQVE